MPFLFHETKSAKLILYFKHTQYPAHRDTPMKFKIVLIFSVFLSGCASGYQQFYNPIVDARAQPEAILLADGQEPEIYGTNNFEQDTLTLRSKNYVLVGYSSFNGAYEGENGAKSQAKRVGATLILVSSEYTNTQTSTSTLFLPNNQTTYHSGTVSGNTTYNSAYSGYMGSSNTTGTYSGTSTTYGTQAVPITTHQRRYETAYYFVKSSKKPKLGIFMQDLTIEQRSQLGRNTGVFIEFVYEDSPAFYANILGGDVLIAVDDNPVINYQQALQLLTSISSIKNSLKLTFLRHNQEKIIYVQL